MQPGYFASNYFSSFYWPGLYWPEWGTPGQGYFAIITITASLSLTPTFKTDLTTGLSLTTGLNLTATFKTDL